MIPKLDGLHVLKKLKSANDTQYIPVLILTALSQEQDMIKAFKYGADDYLTKPFRTEELIMRVKKILM